MEKKLTSIIAFCILMENDKGILNKSPEYVMEKFNNLIVHGLDRPEQLLDLSNQNKFMVWFRKWVR